MNRTGQGTLLESLGWMSKPGPWAGRLLSGRRAAAQSCSSVSFPIQPYAAPMPLVVPAAPHAPVSSCLPWQASRPLVLESIVRGSSGGGAVVWAGKPWAGPKGWRGRRWQMGTSTSFGDWEGHVSLWFYAGRGAEIQTGCHSAAKPWPLWAGTAGVSMRLLGG